MVGVGYANLPTVCSATFSLTHPLMLPCARHPNVFPDGKVCISILHSPGEDAFNPQETANERWSPVHTVGGCSVGAVVGICGGGV